VHACEIRACSESTNASNPIKYAIVRSSTRLLSSLWAGRSSGIQKWVVDKISLEGLSLKKDGMKEKYEKMQKANKVLLPSCATESCACYSPKMSPPSCF